MTATETQTKQSKICETITELYTEYVPNDRKTFNYAIPIVGFAISCFTCGTFIDAVHPYRETNPLYGYSYMVLAAGCAFELYNALEKGNKKQFFFWMLMKFIELIATLTTLCISYSSYRLTALAAMGTINMIVVLLLLFFIGKRAKLTQTANLQEEQSVYDRIQITSTIPTLGENIYKNVY